MTLHHLNTIQAIYPAVDCIPCGGAVKKSVLKGDKRIPVAYHNSHYKVVHQGAKHGSAIKTPIFSDHISGIEWALNSGYPVNNLALILEGMR